MYIDTHAHLTYADKYENIEELAQSLQQENIAKIINVGCTIDSSQMAIEQAEKYSGVYAACGIHPSYVHAVEKGYLKSLEELCKNKYVVAFGECGLDYHYPDFDKKLQQKILLEQLELANALQLPVIFHARDCHDDMLPLLKKTSISLKK